MQNTGVRKRGGVWYVNIQTNGVRKEIPVPGNQADAVRLRTRLKLMARAGEIPLSSATGWTYFSGLRKTCFLQEYARFFNVLLRSVAKRGSIGFGINRLAPYGAQAVFLFPEGGIQ